MSDGATVSTDPSAPEPAGPYVSVYFARKADLDSDPQSERRAAILEGLRQAGISVPVDAIVDPGNPEIQREQATTNIGLDPITGGAAVLIFWSRDADLAMTQKFANWVRDRAVVAELDGVRPFSRQPRPIAQEPQPAGSSIPSVDMARWDGDWDDPLLLALAHALFAKIYQSVSGVSLSENAYQVLARSTGSVRLRPPGKPTRFGESLPSPTDVLLDALAYRPSKGGVGTDLLRVLAQRQERPADELIDQIAPGRREAPGAESIVPGPLPLELLALARHCALQVNGRTEVHLRHLIAAAVLSDSPPLEEDVLDQLGTSAQELPDILLGVLRIARVSDPIAAWERLLAVSLAGGFDRDLVDPAESIPRDRDDLGYGVWAAMLASVIADQTTPMPVSIGLFGEWGSGKSTFMGLLRGEIASLCGRPGYVRDVVSIGFNAWHYADANLWASLGDEIFRALAEALEPPGERAPSVQEKELLAKITEQRSAADDARARRQQAEHAVKVQGERLATQVREARKDRQVHARDLASALFDSPEVRSAARAAADRAWQLLGISDDVERGEMLAGQLDGVNQDRRALRSLLGWRMTWVLAVLCLAGVLLTFAAHVFAGDWGAWLGGAGTWLRHYGGFSTLAAVLASATVLAGRLRAGLSALRSAAAQAADRAGKRANAKIAAARDRLRAAQARERAADAEFERLNADLAGLERQLAGLAPGKRMYAFLAERTASGDYTGQLGLVSVIRKDLEHLVKVLHEHHRQLDKHPSEPGEADPPELRRIDRIVLYIDDLDRCPPRQVVEVLQAVHLLLALDLFVVVVGVDPRWLVRALHQQYPGILNGNGPGAGDGNAARFAGGEAGEALPADYLQKIFNIPFTLPAFRDNRLEQLIRRLADGASGDSTGSAADQEATTETGRRSPSARDRYRLDPGLDLAPPRTVGGLFGVADTSQNADADVGGPTASEAGAAPSISIEPGSQVAAIQAAGPGPERRRKAADAVTTPQRLSEDELRFLGGLGPFVKTPRDAKRLFNVYRMLRATRDLSPASTFLGGEYQAVAMLLAMLTQDPHVFVQAVDAPAGPGSGVSGGLAWTEPQYQNWADFVGGLTPERSASDRLTSDQAAGPVHGWQNRVVGEIPAADLTAWSSMARAAHDTSALVTLPDLAAFRAWVPHVRRFSYLPLTPARHRQDPARWPDGPPSGGRGPGEAAEAVRDDGF